MRGKWIASAVLLALACLAWLLLRDDVPNVPVPDEAGRGREAEPAPALTAQGESPVGPGLRGTARAAEGRPEAPVNEGKVGAFAGEFSFHYKQGYSFERRAVVGVEDADLVFKTCAGGISSITLEVPGGGIAGGGVLRSKLPAVKTTLPVFEAVLGGEPDALRLAATADGDSRSPTSDVFLARTRRGEWVKLAIVGRNDQVKGGWTHALATVRFELQPDEPVFRPGPGNLSAAGFILDTSGIEARDAALVAAAEAQEHEDERPLRARMDVLDARAARLRADVQARAGATHDVAAVLGRSHADTLHRKLSYQVSTYSFEHATRDDAKATRNDWDFVFSWFNGVPWFRVTTVTDDRSRIRDLGDMDFDAALRGVMSPGEGVVGVAAVVGHLYVLHTLDSDSDYWILLRVIDMTLGDGTVEDVILEWARVADPEPLRHALQGGRTELTQGRAVLQLATDHGGGNPHQAFLDGTKNAYVDKLAEAPLDFGAASARTTRSAAHVDGGYVPVGKTFRVTQVEFWLRLRGDGGARVDCTVQVGAYPVAWLVPWPGAGREGDLQLYTMSGGLERVRRDQLPLRRVVEVDIPVRRDDEQHVYVEAASYTDLDVTLTGSLGPTDAREPVVSGGTSGAKWARRGALRSLLTADPSTLAGVGGRFAHVDHAREWLTALRDAARNADYRKRLELALASLD